MTKFLNTEQSVDLTNLRTMTDGDAEMEKALFEEFHSSFEEGMNGLQVSNEEKAKEDWRCNAHALRGMALNLGAQKLGDLCNTAQSNYSTTPDVRDKILQDIRKEYNQVKLFLNKLL